MAQFDAFLNTYGLAAIFVLLLVKSVGIPLPLPAGAILLAAALGCAHGSFTFSAAFLTLLAASLIGNTTQFLLLRGPARRFIYRFGRHVGMTPARLDFVAEQVNKSRWAGISVLLFTPGLRAVTIVACALSAVPFRRFAVALVVATIPSLALNLYLYYLGGKSLEDLTLPLPVVAALLLILVAVAVPIGLIVRKRLILSRF